MTPELYQRLKPLYDAAREAPKEARGRFIAESRQIDTEAGDALCALLAANDDEAGLLDVPILHFENNALRLRRSFLDGDVVLGRFRILRYLAAGGMGEVYEAEDLFLHDLHVALKTIRPNIAADPELRRRFKREVVLAREVSHPNLCPIYDIFQCDEPPPGFLFLTMKLLPGGTLTALLRSGEAISLEEKESIVKQIALGLAAIHAAGIVHLDIKPNNIMLDRSGGGPRLWITDFGLARAFESDSTISAKPTVAGTPGYVAPELYLGSPPSRASDLFAYGVVLHELFTGKKPTLAPGSSTYVASPLLMSSEVPAYCAELITECLNGDPARRCKAFENALEMMGGRRAGGEFWTRRRFIGAAAASIGAAATGTWWKWDAIEDRLYPLPQKRFVALLPWPKTPDSQPLPTLTGVLTAIKSELARAEAFDRNFFVISPEDLPQDLSAAVRLKEICDPLGANLVLAASGLTRANEFELFLRLLEPVSGRALRGKKLTCPLKAITTLPDRAVRAAAALLNLNQYLPGKESAAPPTQSAEAFAAFQTAEKLMNHPTGRSLDQAIAKYNEAIDLDPDYALAHAKLAVAYARLFVTRADPGALDLARGNSERALAVDPSLVEGYFARADVLQLTGDENGALHQIVKALQLDPSNPQALLQQAQIYSDQQRWPDAEAAYHKVLEKRPNWWVTYNELGVALDRQGKYEDSIRAYRAASLAAPGNAFVLCNLGIEYVAVGDFAEATKNLRKSVAIDPNYDVAAANTSFVLRCQGKYKEALPFALKATELNPGDDFNWLELGDCYFSLGHRKSEAAQAYMSAAKVAARHLETNPADGPAWMALALYQVKSGQVKSGDSRDPLLLIQKAELLGAADMDSQLYKARLYELLGKRDAALETLETCFRRGANDIQLAAFPEMQSLRKDSRYQTMRRRFQQQQPKTST
jgi:tetratricopeptide (TPR) repeat protein/tRNA A-37 threonylcarbamoyl transferase component Bud32